MIKGAIKIIVFLPLMVLSFYEAYCHYIVLSYCLLFQLKFKTASYSVKRTEVCCVKLLSVPELKVQKRSSREKMKVENATKQPKSKCPDWNTLSLAMTSTLSYVWTLTLFDFENSLLANIEWCWCNIQSQHTCRSHLGLQLNTFLIIN